MVDRIRSEIGVINHCIDFFFGYARKMEETSFEASSSVSQDMDQEEDEGDIVDHTEKKRSFNLKQIKTYNMIKKAIWNCGMPTGPVPKEERVVDLVLLRDLMREI